MSLWVLYWLLHSKTFEEVIIGGAANMGNDSDTIAAIAGGLKGIEAGFYTYHPSLKIKYCVKKALKYLPTKSIKFGI